ncbi:MAG: hypothetical protein P8J86_08435 [Phycisphaerales bacterium]|nr:hypothetical protein [Phycisphaerales bacterium]
MTNTAGGNHHRAEMHRAFWLQLAGSDLLIIDPVTAVKIATISLSEPGLWSQAVDMVIVDDRLWVVMDGVSVIEVDVANPRKAKILTRIDKEKLGLRPRYLTTRGNQVWVSGDEGVRRIDEAASGSQVQSLEGCSSRMVFVDGRAVVCVGRRIVDAENGTYLGSATQLYRLPGVLDPKRRFLFVREGRQGSLVGVMSEGMREVHDAGGVPGSGDLSTSGNATLFHLGRVYSVRFFDNSIWVVGDGGIDVFRLRGDNLIRQSHIPVRGARDIMPVADNYIAVVGSFGRSLYRFGTDELGPGDTFFNVVRSPGGLAYAVADGRHILAGSGQGYWLYKASTNDAVPWPEPKEELYGPVREAVINEMRLKLAADGKTAVLEDAQRQYVWAAPSGSTLSTVVSVEGDFWVGHDDGIIVLQVQDTGGVSSRDTPDAASIDEEAPQLAGTSLSLVEVESMPLPGPIHALQPLLSGRGAAYASPAGFGTVEWVNTKTKR